MISIRAIGIHNTLPKSELPDLARELKSLSGKVYRRTDHFIQLAIIGAHKAVNGYELPDQTAIYITSGQGNISVFDRVCEQSRLWKLLPRPVDFINLQSNSAGFYVAAHLGLNGKNLFLSHHHFPVQMTMLAAQNDVQLGKQKAVLIGGVDEWIPKQELAGKLLGVDKTTALGEGSNWMLISAEAEDAVGTFEMEPKFLDKTQLHRLLSAAETETYLAFSRHFPESEATKITNMHTECKRYCYENSCGYYETLPLYVLNRFLSKKKGRLIHVDVNEERYMVMNVDNNGLALA